MPGATAGEAQLPSKHCYIINTNICHQSPANSTPKETRRAVGSLELFEGTGVDLFGCLGRQPVFSDPSLGDPVCSNPWAQVSNRFSVERTLPLPCTGPLSRSLTSGRQDRASWVTSKCNPLGRLGDSWRPADTCMQFVKHTEAQAGCSQAGC